MESLNFKKITFPAAASKKIAHKKNQNNNNNNNNNSKSSIIISPPLSPKKSCSKKLDYHNYTAGNINNSNNTNNNMSVSNIITKEIEIVQKPPPSSTFNNVQDVYNRLTIYGKPRYRMRWSETPNELREFIENNKKISSADSSSCASSPTFSVASSPASSTISTTSPTNTIYVYNVAARSSSSIYSDKHAYASSSSPSSVSSASSTFTTPPAINNYATSPSFDVMRIATINNNNNNNGNNNNNTKKESSRSHHRHQPYSTKSSKSSRKTSSFRRSNVKGNDHPHTSYYGHKGDNSFSLFNHNDHNYILNKGKGRGVYDDNHITEMSSLNTTPTLGQSSDTSSSDSTPPASPKHNNRPSSAFIIAKKQSRKKFNNVRRSSDTNAITTNRQYGVTKNHGDGSSSIISERKRKSNSLARVMADRGLLEESIIPVTSSTAANSGEVKSIRIPPSPPLEYEKLIENLNNMNLENRILNAAEPNITWKGQPLSITHLPHYDALHPKEAFVASALRLTPVQYLTAKHTLVSAAQRYTQRNFPFKKSDAQKLLRIDVNKASKLWEFFRQVEWI